MPRGLTIRPARTPSDLRIAKKLIIAYAAALNVDLAFQDFKTEIADLRAKYGPPGGEILLAFDGDEDEDEEGEGVGSGRSSGSGTPSESESRYKDDDDDDDENETTSIIGCVALRPLPSETETHGLKEKEKKICELKRLYVLPAARGRGVGKALMEAMMDVARDLGYDEMRLDTRVDMLGPRRMYAAMGFGEIGPYYEIEEGILEGMVFFGRGLR